MIWSVTYSRQCKCDQWPTGRRKLFYISRMPLVHNFWSPKVWLDENQFQWKHCKDTFPERYSGRPPQIRLIENFILCPFTMQNITNSSWSQKPALSELQTYCIGVGSWEEHMTSPCLMSDPNIQIFMYMNIQISKYPKYLKYTNIQMYEYPKIQISKSLPHWVWNQGPILDCTDQGVIQTDHDLEWAATEQF